MHYAEFAEDESQALMNAIKEYENNKWKTIGQKVGKPAKVCPLCMMSLLRIHHANHELHRHVSSTLRSTFLSCSKARAVSRLEPEAWEVVIAD